MSLQGTAELPVSLKRQHCCTRRTFSGPQPRPSRISIVMDRETTSLDAKSFADGAYLNAQNHQLIYVPRSCATAVYPPWINTVNLLLARCVKCRRKMVGK